MRLENPKSATGIQWGEMLKGKWIYLHAATEIHTLDNNPKEDKILIEFGWHALRNDVIGEPIHAC